MFGSNFPIEKLWTDYAEPGGRGPRIVSRATPRLSSAPCCTTPPRASTGCRGAEMAIDLTRSEEARD